MSEATRARYLFLRNRLEELFSLYGPPPAYEPQGIECDPTWGPLGSLARRAWGDDAVDALLAMDRDMARSASKITPEPASSSVDVQPGTEQPAAPSRVLEASTAMRRLDKHGETPLFGCPVCGEESAKASVPLDLWRCTHCGTTGRASRLPGGGGPPATPVHVA